MKFQRVQILFWFNHQFSFFQYVAHVESKDVLPFSYQDTENTKNVSYFSFGEALI